MKKKGKLIFVVFFTCIVYLHAQTEKQIKKIRSECNLTALENLKQSIQNKKKLQRENILRVAKIKGWKTEKIEDGRLMRLRKIENNTPIYYTTLNAYAAISTRTDHLHSGGSLGLNLMGKGLTTHIWEVGGIARGTHQEFDGAGGTNRFSIGDGSTSLSYHATLVTGTIISSGVVSLAKGMAPHSKAVGYDANNDISEAINAATNGMLISNNSYGFDAEDVPDYYFGAYIGESRSWDQIMFNAPYYLMVNSAGNNGIKDYNSHPLEGNGRYDKLTGHSTSKNSMVVANADDAIVDANGNLMSVRIHYSSSQGPTDDLRIKPDISGNGTYVFSTLSGSDTDYGNHYQGNPIIGTSFACPNVSGSLLLLQEHYKNLNNGAFMKAATLKGLALHTADGHYSPNAILGWGLLNAKKAAETITLNGDKSVIEELVLASNQVYTYTVTSDGINPLMASISWTDRPGTATTNINNSTPVLVNDLDIRVEKSGTEYKPWKLTGVTTNGKGDNNVDPFERVDVTGASGTYTITVSHKGTLSGGSQNYSLIITGITACDYSNSISKDVTLGEVDIQKALNNLTAYNKIYNGGEANYNAGEIIRLKPGFKVYSGGVFNGFIEACESSSSGSSIHLKSVESIKYEEDTSKIATNFLNVYPSPFNNELNINASKEIITWRLISINGKTLKQGTSKLEKINTSNLSSGIYILEVALENNEIVRKKIIKNKS